MNRMLDALDVQIEMCSQRLRELQARRRIRDEAQYRAATRTKKFEYRARRHRAMWLRLRGMKYKEVGERLGVTASRAREMFRRSVRDLWKRRPREIQHIVGNNWLATNCLSESCMVWPSDDSRFGLRGCFSYNDNVGLAVTSCSTNINLDLLRE